MPPPAGLLLPEDMESGVISHALAFAIPGLRNLSPDPYEPLPSDYFYPTSTTETDYYNTNPNALAAGQRIRLKQTIVDDLGDPIDETRLAPITRMFLTALRTHGAYLVDNAGGFIFYAEEITTADLHLTDGEVSALIGESSGTPLPASKTKWQIVMEALNGQLVSIPFAYGTAGQGAPATAQVIAANFEVVAPATRPACPDVTHDGSVDLDDIRAVATGWGITDADPDWNQYSDYDLDRDNDIDVVDVMLVARHWGEPC